MLYKIRSPFLMVALASVPMLLSACLPDKYDNIKRTIQVERAETDAALREMKPTGEQRGVLMVDHTPWFGSHSVAMQNGDPLPSEFLRQDSIVVTFDGPKSVRETAALVQSATGIRIIVSEGGSGDGTFSRGAEGTFTPVNGVEVSGGRTVWQGRLNDILNQLADSYDADWTYKNGNIYLSQEVTRTFMLHALASDIDFSGSIQSGTGSASTAAPEIGISSEATLAIWEQIEESIDSILEGRGRASYAPAMGTITVTGAPLAVKEVEEFLNIQNAQRLRRIAVSVRVVNVTIEDTNNIGLEIQSLIERAIGDRPFQFDGLAGGLTAGVLNAAPAGVTNDQVSAIVSALERERRVLSAQSGSIVTLSDQPAPLQIGRQISYLERTSAVSGAGSSDTISLEPGTIDVGLTMNILPRVIQKDRVMLRLALSITDADRNFPTFGTTGANAVEIQLPEVETSGFLQNAVLRSGETLVLAGFERNESSRDDQGVPGAPLLLGGSSDFNKSREVTVLFITSQILPEDPLTVVSKRY